MKNRKNLGCRIKDKKERGAWAELYFMVLAMSQGMRVSSPYGGFGPYDVGVEGSTGPILRVQVKCTLCRCRQGSYSISVNRSYGAKHRRGYAPGTVDFFALFLIPTDDWYIIPYAVIGDRDANLHFRPEFRRQKYGDYKEAWHLLRKAAKGKGNGPLNIRACCDDGDAAGARKLMQPSAVRRIFQGVFQREGSANEEASQAREYVAKNALSQDDNYGCGAK
jgi:hypothetical protein